MTEYDKTRNARNLKGHTKWFEGVVIYPEICYYITTRATPRVLRSTNPLMFMRDIFLVCNDINKYQPTKNIEEMQSMMNIGLIVDTTSYTKKSVCFFNRYDIPLTIKPETIISDWLMRSYGLKVKVTKFGNSGFTLTFLKEKLTIELAFNTKIDEHCICRCLGFSGPANEDIFNFLRIKIPKEEKEGD